jgi:histidyl-tRNA synthetase
MVEQIGAGEREVAVLVAIDKLDKIGEEGVRNLLLKEEFSAEQVDALFEMLNTGKINGIESELANLEAIKEIAVAMGVDSERLVIDFTLARGLDYYTGPVFETIFTDDNIGSISGGGRYDGLIGMFGKKNVPAVGVSLGLERLITIMEEREMLSEDSAVDLWVTVFDAELQKETLEIAQEFRKAGVRTMVSMRSGKLGKQFKDANKAGAKWVVVYGSDDKEKGAVLLKNLEKGEQYSLPLAEAVQKILEA